MRQSEDMTNDPWPVAGSRLRPNPPRDSSWDGVGHLPADWDSTPGELTTEDYDWEAMLASALGVAAPARVMLPDVDAVATEAEEARDLEPVVAPTASDPEPDPAPENTIPTIVAAAGVTPWSGDDILPHRRNGQKRRRFFRR